MREINWRSLSLRDYLHILNRRKWAVIIPFVIVVGAAILFSYHMTPVYEATATLIAEEITRSSVLRGLADLPIPPAERLDLIKQRMMSRRLLTQVADKLNLRAILEEKKGIKIADTGAISAIKKLWLTALEKLKLRKPQEKVTDEDIVRYLRDCISLKIRSRVVEIKVLNSDPKLAMDIANTLADTYINDLRQRRLNEVSATYNFITSQLQIYKEKLDQAEKALEEARKSGLLASLTQENIDLVNKLTEVEADLVRVELDIREKTQQISEIEAKLGSPGSGTYDPEVVRWRDRVAALERQLNSLLTKYKETWPEVRKVRGELEAAKEKLRRAEERAYAATQKELLSKLQRLRRELEDLNLRKIELTRKRNRYQRILDQLPPENLTVSHLLREKQQCERIYSLLLSRLDEANLLTASEMQQMGAVAEVLDRAIMPERPVKPNKKKIAVLAVGLGLMMGFGLLFTLEYFDHSIHSVEEAEKYFSDVPVLGVIPKLRV